MARKGYADGFVTYGQVIASKGLKDRMLAKLGDFLDRFVYGDGPLFPKDAPLHQPNCGVVAMCMLTDAGYDAVVDILGRDFNERWIGGTYRHQYGPCAAELGHKVTINNAPKGTLTTLCEETAKTKERVFATVFGHAVVVWDGLIFDQSFPAGATPAEHPCRNDRLMFTMTRD